ncbi:MAG: TonB-dependent receptor plug domain-containing protein [Flavobacteriales bacterium]
MKNIFLFTLLFSGSIAWGQEAIFTGKVVVNENGEKVPVAFVKVLILNADSTVAKGAVTDFDGTFKVQTKPGKNLVSFRQGGLKNLIFEIELSQGFNEPLLVEMQAPLVEFDIVQVVAIRNKTAVSDLNEEIKESSGMDSKQTSEQITAQGSSDTKEALTKMSGISSSNSVLYVRGMGDRYNAAYLNGLPVPSPNPELRVIPMNIFPTSIIDVLEVGKMMAPNYYGDFAGGVINIRTKRVFRNPTLNISIGGGVNTGTTFKSFDTYNGGKFDYLGFDDGSRTLSDQVKSASIRNATSIYKDGLYSSDEMNNGTGFANNFNPRRTTAQPAQSFKIEGGNYRKFVKENSGIGFVVMASHNTGFQIQNGNSRFINAQNQLQYDFETKKETFSTSSSGLFTLLYDLNKKTSLTANYLFINNSDDENFQTWGYHRDFGEEKEVYSRRYTFKQNQLHNFQILGSTKEILKGKLNLNYGASYSITSSVEPDRRQISAQYSDRNDISHYRLLALDANHTHRFFSDLNESEIALHGDLDYTFFENKKADTVLSSLKLIVGGDVKVKDRSFKFRQFNYLAKPLADQIGDNFDINSPDAYLNDENLKAGLFRIEESANPGNGYSAYQDIKGGNIGMRWMINYKWEVIPNVRLESGFQSVESRNQVQADKIDRNIISGLDFMPSLAAKFNINENQLIRFGASRTITRPKFFEVAPFEYLAQIAGMAQIGNPNLTNGINNNLDLRYEVYTKNSGDMISIGGFGKILETPIEQIMRPSSGGQIISFDNTDGGLVTGIELEYAKNLSFLVKEEKRDNSKLKNFSLAGNIAYIYSQITIDDQTGFTTNPRRPLQGASPFMFNVSAKYEKLIRRSTEVISKDPMKMMFALTYSYSGKSLYAVGTQGVGDQYQFQNNTLNAVVNVKMNSHWAVGIKGNNLTNNLFRVMQEDRINAGDWQEVNTYKLGSNISGSVTYSF